MLAEPGLPSGVVGTRDSMMARKALWLLLPAALGAAVASQWQDIARYLKIERMSAGQGNPQLVPASGKHAYPDGPGAGASDGTGDFDSARRGGPELIPG
jgi:hypothetical protein